MKLELPLLVTLIRTNSHIMADRHPTFFITVYPTLNFLPFCSDCLFDSTDCLSSCAERQADFLDLTDCVDSLLRVATMTHVCTFLTVTHVLIIGFG